MEFDRVANIVSECWMTTREIDEWKEIHKYLDLGFPLSYSHVNNFATLSENGQRLVEEGYAIIRDSLGIDDKEYDNFEAMLDENIAINSEQEEPDDTN